MDRVALQLRCGAPAQVRAEAELEAHEDPEEGRVEVGLQRGRATRFRARFRDAAGRRRGVRGVSASRRSILNASEYWLRWSLSPSSKEGVPFTKAASLARDANGSATKIQRLCVKKQVDTD